MDDGDIIVMMVTLLPRWWHHCHDGDIIVTVKSVVLTITADVSVSNSTRENAKITHIWISKLSSINNTPNAGSDDDFVWQHSYYLNQHWHIIDLTLWNKFKWNFNQNTNIFLQENAFEYVVCKMSVILSQPQCIKNVFVKMSLVTMNSEQSLLIRCHHSQGACWITPKTDQWNISTLVLTHFDVVMPNGFVNLGHHWVGWWLVVP